MGVLARHRPGTRPHGLRALGYGSGANAVHASFALSDDGSEDSVEIWTFLRRPGAKSLAAAGPIEGLCPCCGAAREVGGWAALRAKDPALSLEALEDRAAVIFCRWLEARRNGDAGPLRGVAPESALKTLPLDKPPKPGSAIWGVETAAFQSSADFDHAHVQVSWRDGRSHESHFLILARRAEARSDLKAGLRTAHCPSCGAPPAAPDEPACRYCAASFVDGSRHWVLTGIVPFGVWRRPAPAA